MADKDFQVRNSTIDFLVFTKQNSTDSIQVRVHDENVWLTQKSMAQLFECSLETKEEKTAFCHQHHIALYDVLESCDIHGSSDSSIKNAKPNDLCEILQNSQIEMIFTTGKKAYSLYQKYQEKQTGIAAICLASPSPANASKKLKDLVEDYQVILKYTA